MASGVWAFDFQMTIFNDPNVTEHNLSVIPLLSGHEYRMQVDAIEGVDYKDCALSA